MKKPDRQNITTIIHDIKEEYSLRFREKVPQTKEMEEVIIAAAREVKKGNIAEWYIENGVKTLKISPRQKYKRFTGNQNKARFVQK